MSHILNILARIAKSQVEDEDGAEPMVGTQFSKETRVRDEDEEMKKFIDENASFQGCFTEVCFRHLKRKPAVIFSK